MSSCFLLRDGRKQACTVVPSDLQLFVYSDQAGAEVRALLDPASQQRLLRAQPPAPMHSLRRSRRNRISGPQQRNPAAA